MWKGSQPGLHLPFGSRPKRTRETDGRLIDSISTLWPLIGEGSVKERRIYFYSKDIYSRITVHCMLVVAMVTLYIYIVSCMLEIMLL